MGKTNKQDAEMLVSREEIFEQKRVTLAREGTQVEYVTTDEAAEIMGLSRPRIYQLVSAGRLESIKVGSTYLIAKESAENFIPKPEGWKKGRARK
jgi:excisionase family DNA binding protein